MEDRKIEELERAAVDYADIRDERMELNKTEKERKDVLFALMHKHGKTSYIQGEIEITIVPEGEKLKVKVRKEDNGDQEDE